MNIPMVIAQAVESTDVGEMVRQAVQAAQEAQGVQSSFDWNEVLPIIAVISVFAFLLAAVIALFVLVRVLASRKTNLIQMAIQNNQPDVAKEIVRTRPMWILWIVLGIVLVVAIDRFYWWVTLILGIVALGTAKEWWPIVVGERSVRGLFKRQEPLGPPPTGPAAPAGPSASTAPDQGPTVGSQT